LEKETNPIFILFFLALFAIFSATLVLGAQCYSYTQATNSSCTPANGCIWKLSVWGDYCTTLSCWNLNSQSLCSSIVVPGTNCSWTGGTEYSTCENIACDVFDGTDPNSCENNTAGFSCSWEESCYSYGGQADVYCNINQNQTACLNQTGCTWGSCYGYECFAQDSSTCNALKDDIGNNCTWAAIGEGGFCKRKNCWDYALFNNESTCDDAEGISCEWKWDSCQSRTCGSFDGNQTGCQNSNTTYGLDCIWDGSSYCYADECWNYASNATCSVKSECSWIGRTSSAWCEEVSCWTWNQGRGGSESACAGNATLFGISCIWTNQTNTPGSNGTGWCEQDFSSTNCTGFTTDRGCADSYYCWWQANDWANVSEGGNCTEPTWGSGDYSDLTPILNDWNPGCYIFDNNLTRCNQTIGCDYGSNECVELNTAEGDNISATGIVCSYVNDSTLCNDIASLSTCCTWQNGTCLASNYSTSCINNLQQTPKGETACEDAKAKGDCDTIAGEPWYMPCRWDNSSTPAKCAFKADKVFGNTTHSIVKIENQRNCLAAGGKWITEDYCELSVAVPTGRCEYKFDDERDCDKTCFACEYQTGSGFIQGAGITVNSTNAEEACISSVLGFCTYSLDTQAPNGIGYCNAKEEWKKGTAGDCDSNCGDCTYKGDPNNNDTTKRPSYYCDNSNANSVGGGCKWIADNSTTFGGYCLEKGALTCLDSCDRCDNQKDCANIGRTALANQSGSCKWQGADQDGNCVANIAGDVEVCWNGVDDTNDGLIDCADPGCYSDSFCGFTVGNCFVWSDTNNTLCEAAGCEWIIDQWGSWCDFKGSQCWKNDNNESTCGGVITTSTTINITIARIAGNEIDNSVRFHLNINESAWVTGSIFLTNNSGTNFTGNFTVDYDGFGINLTNGTFLKSIQDNITKVNFSYYKLESANCEWQNGTGNGFCERDWSVNEACFGFGNESDCYVVTNCAWTNDTWCDGTGNGTDWCNGAGGWCDHTDFLPKDCWQYNNDAGCSEVSGCNWQGNPYSSAHCEVNWTGKCGTISGRNNCLSEGCDWLNESWGSWCDVPMGECYLRFQNQTVCEGVSGGRCHWQTFTGGNGGTCTGACNNATLNNVESLCSGLDGCTWVESSGWCEEQHAESCYNSTNSNSQTACEASDGCRWNDPGWCSPKDGGFSTGVFGSGGGIGGGLGSDCFKYDGNQSYCTNQTLSNITCGWYPESNPRCDVDWSTDCWLNLDESTCQSGGCWWKNDSYGTWCMNSADECWSNETLQNSTVQCNTNAYCNSTSYGCEPTCFTRDSTDCFSGSSCKYVTGWCNPAGVNEVFDNMEAGAPVPIGEDECGEAGMQASVDICGFGMKDTGDSYGFGIMVSDFSNASTCNKETISTHVVGSFGGGFGEGAGFGASQVGSGNDSVKFFVYLDTDGSSTNNCVQSNNISAKGYEFRLRYTADWDPNKSKTEETFTSYECSNGNWKTTDIKISAWKKIMCSEIGGAMLAVKKSDFARFPLLYDSTADMRIYVSTSGNTGNVTSPTDTAGPVYVTPGSIDFEISDVFSYGADVAKYEDILRRGFVQYEDCFNSVDDDGDGNIDCNDWDCEYSSQCANTGVNSLTYIDTTTPQVTGVKIEEYPDAALIMYDTNKPTNGTLEFYSNDTRCLKLNNTVKDIGITSSNVRQQKLWHKAEIYDKTVSSPLATDTAYYYKLKVCDSNNNCAVSRCSSFTTAASENQCGFCNFVTQIKAGTDWTVSYDANQNGSYDHVQGQICGPNAGMKTNYTMGRMVNIKLEKTDNTVYFEFINASLTKTALNDKVRTISASGDIIGTSDYIGLTSETRDKIINNLHPEICRIKIPFSGTCDKLFHCDDSGANCIERTSDATLIDSTNCVWEVPNCEFSTYREAESSGTTTGGSSGGSGGGGSGSGGGGGSTGTTSTTTGYERAAESGDDDSTSDTPTDKDTGSKTSDSKSTPIKNIAKKSKGILSILIIALFIGIGIAAIIYLRKRKTIQIFSRAIPSFKNDFHKH